MLKEFFFVLFMAFGFWCLFMLIGIEVITTDGPFYVPITWGFLFLFFLVNGVGGVLFWIFKHRKPTISLRIGAVCIVFIPLTLLYFPLGRLMWKHQFSLAQTYPVTLASPLEAYKKTQGHYPDTLDQLSLPPKLPPGLIYSKYAGRDAYFFSYPDWDAFFGAYLYDSNSHQWHYDKDDD